MRFLILMLCLQSASLLAAPRVVTSIAALQEITASLMAGVGVPQSIIAEGASTHHFALRPSHMRLLQQADLMIWIDRHFEAGFGQLAQTLPGSTNQLELLPALALGNSDGHIWFSPQRLQQVIEAITGRLVEIDPGNRSRYRENASRLSADIAAWRASTLAQLQARPPRFITDHAFTRHFEEDMGFAAIASIHDQHDDHSGLRELGQIESRLREQAVNCLLTLETTPAPLALELAQKYHLKIIKLITAPDDASPTAPIVQRLQQFAAALRECG